MENGQSQPAAPAETVASEPTTWTIPDGVKNVLAKITTEQQKLLLSIGILEADYLTEKNRLLKELGDQKKLWQTTLDAAARAGGLDIDKERWLLDLKESTLVRR